MNDYFPYFDGVILNPLLILQTNSFKEKQGKKEKNMRMFIAYIYLFFAAKNMKERY